MTLTLCLSGDSPPTFLYDEGLKQHPSFFIVGALCFRPGVPFLHVIPTLFSLLETAESRRRFRVRDLVRRYGPETPKEELVREGGAIGRSMTSRAADTVRGSIVCLSFLQGNLWRPVRFT